MGKDGSEQDAGQTLGNNSSGWAYGQLYLQDDGCAGIHIVSIDGDVGGTDQGIKTFGSFQPGDFVAVQAGRVHRDTCIRGGTHTIIPEQIIAWPGQGPLIKVVAAVYGASQGSMDVTGVVQSLIKKGTFEFEVSNATFGSDPAPGDVKHFSVVYVQSASDERLVNFRDEGQKASLTWGQRRAPGE